MTRDFTQQLWTEGGEQKKTLKYSAPINLILNAVQHAIQKVRGQKSQCVHKNSWRERGRGRGGRPRKNASALTETSETQQSRRPSALRGGRQIKSAAAAAVTKIVSNSNIGKIRPCGEAQEWRGSNFSHLFQDLQYHDMSHSRNKKMWSNLERLVFMWAVLCQCQVALAEEARPPPRLFLLILKIR